VPGSEAAIVLVFLGLYTRWQGKTENYACGEGIRMIKAYENLKSLGEIVFWTLDIHLPVKADLKGEREAWTPVDQIVT
jgi:hypothetical protein